MTMKRLLVGGPLLGDRNASVNEESTKRKSFEPLITPLITGPGPDEGEQFILMPHGRFIQVLAFQTGKPIANLVPFGVESPNEKIESVCLATYPTKPPSSSDIFGQFRAPEKESTVVDAATRKSQEDCLDHVLLVGCSDGCLYEFSLRILLASSFAEQNTKGDDCGPWALVGPCYGPRRTFQLSSNRSTAILHLAAPSCVARTDYGLLVYALNQKQETEKNDSQKKVGHPMVLLRLLLPPYYDNTIMEKKQIIQLWKEGGNDGDNEFGRIQKIDKFPSKVDAAPVVRLEAVVRDCKQGLFHPGNVSLRAEQYVYLVVAKPMVVQVYCEKLEDIGLTGSNESQTSRKFSPVSFSLESSLCSMTISTNKSDVACGFEKGHIVIKSNLLALVEEYNLALERYHDQANTTTADNNGKKITATSGGVQKPKHPSETVIDAKVHWHAHPVTTMCYDPNSSPTDPILYSGGEESVLVTWQLSRGVHRPSDLLPRIARRGIMHMSCTKRTDGAPNSNDCILVFCEDNTLRLFESHNKVLLWKLEGLATWSNKKSNETKKNTFSITSDPRSAGSSSAQLVINGLPDAPGSIQWYDASQQQVVGHLEVAPFNRVSAMDHNFELPMPEPTVTHLTMSGTANDLMTIDKVPTENAFVGVEEKVTGKNEEKFGVVPTVKFWALNTSMQMPTDGDESSKQYQLIAAMAHPHGAGRRVTAATMSRNGQFACTVSNDEKAFRVWDKLATESAGRRKPRWVCQCKVTFPCGFSNHPVGKNAVALSWDGSILVICFGHMISVWDRFNVTLLTCLHHFDGEDAIDSVEFVKEDLIMCRSPSGVSVQSLFSTPDLAGISWIWSVKKNQSPPVTVSSSQLLASHDVVAISMYCEQEETSRIVLIDVTTGEPAKGKEGAMVVESVPGLVCSMSESSSAPKKSNWRNESDTADDSALKSLVLYALTNNGEMFELKECSTSENKALKTHQFGTESAKGIPSIPMAAGTTTNLRPTKRRRITASQSIDAGRLHDKKLAVVNYGSMLDENGNAVPLQASELPSLSGGFARAFVGRNLAQTKDK